MAGVAGVSGDMGADNDGENKLVCFTLTAGVDLGIDSADLDKVIRALGVWVTAWSVCWEGQGLWGRGRPEPVDACALLCICKVELRLLVGV